MPNADWMKTPESRAKTNQGQCGARGAAKTLRDTPYCRLALPNCAVRGRQQCRRGECGKLRRDDDDLHRYGILIRSRRAEPIR